MPSSSDVKAGGAFVELLLDDTKLQRGLKRAQAKLRAFGRSVTAMGRGLLRLSAITAAPFAFGAKTFADFEQQMAMVSTMLIEPEKHMKRFSAGIRKMSVQFGEDTGSLAKGLYDILSASVAPEHALGVLDQAMRAAKGGMTDAATATQAIINVLNAFHIPASRAGDVADMLFTTVKRGVLTFDDLAQSVGMVTAMASATGLSMEAMGAALATMTRNGLKAETSTVALQNILKEFLNPSEQGAALARQYGIELSVMGLKADGLLGIMRKLEKLPPNVISKMFPNIRGLRGIFAIRGDVAGLAKDLELMGHKAGATDTAFRKMMNTLFVGFGRAWQIVKRVSSAIGQAIGGTLRAWIDRFVEISRWVTAVIDKNKALIVSIMKIVLIVGAAGAALIALGLTFKLLAMALGGFGLIVSVVVGIWNSLIAVLGIVASPLGAIIALLVAASAALLYFTGYGGKLLAWLGRRFEALKNTATEAWGGIAKALASGNIALAAKILWLTLKMEWQKGVHALTEIWAALSTVIMNVASSAFYGALKIAAGAWDGMRSLWVSTVSFMSKIWANFAAGILKVWNSTQGALAKGFLKIMSLFDSDIDYEAGAARIDKNMGQSNTKIESDRKRDIAKSDAQYTKALARIGDDYKATAAQIDKDARATAALQRKEHHSQVNASASALDKAKDEWRKALEDAGKKVAAEKAEETPAQKYKAKMRGANDAIKNVAGGIGGESIVSFSAAALFGMGASSAADRTASATEKANQYLRDIKKNTDESLAFG